MSLPLSSRTITKTLALPSIPALRGKTLFTQALGFDPAHLTGWLADVQK